MSGGVEGWTKLLRVLQGHRQEGHIRALQASQGQQGPPLRRATCSTPSPDGQHPQEPQRMFAQGWGLPSPVTLTGN